MRFSHATIDMKNRCAARITEETGVAVTWLEAANEYDIRGYRYFSACSAMDAARSFAATDAIARRTDYLEIEA